MDSREKEEGSGSKGIRMDLYQFISKPDHTLYSLMINIVGAIKETVSPKYSNMLSAYREMCFSSAPNVKPMISREVLIRNASGSPTSAKRKGYSGQPYLVPLFNAKEFDSRPFAYILDVGAL